jgi:RecA/RadA recombinase
MNDMFKDILKSLGNEYAAPASQGTYADIDQFIDTGSYALNALFSGNIFGGFPSNKITALAGETTTGKTFFMLSIVKHYLEMNPSAIVVIFESEGAITKDMLTSRNIDVNRILMVPVETIQQFKSQCLRLVDNYLEEKKKEKNEQRKMMICLDSLGMLSTTKEVSDTESGSDKKDMTRQSEIRAAFRVLTLKLSKAGIPMILTNHVYQNVGQMYGPKNTVSGGGGLLYASNNIIMLSKSKEKDSDGLQIGVKIKCTAFKSRLTKEGSVVDVLLNFQTGLDRYYGLFDIAIESGTFEKISTRVKLPDGTTCFEKNIKEDPKKYFTEEVLQKLNQYIQSNMVYGGVPVETFIDDILDN